MKIKKPKSLLPAFQKNNIPIVFSSDNNYCPYLGVAIKSLIENSSIKNNYDILILNEEISEEYKNKIFSLIKKLNNFSIRFINVKKFIKDSKIFYISGYFSVAAYYRLFIEKICKNYEKIIYFDCDIVVVKDIEKLFNIDLKDNLLGAVRTHGLSKDPNYTNYIINILKIPDQSKYFNSGVLLINIKNIIKFDLLKKSLDKLKIIKKPIFVDQCILNSVCFGKVKFIGKEYNHYAGFIKNSNKKIIVHYNGEKPWKNSETTLGNLFWKYAKLTDFYEIINYNNLTKKQKINLYLNYKKNRKSKIVIYTAFTGNYDNLIQHKYISKDFDYVCFTDKNIKKSGIWKIKPITNNNFDLNRKAKEFKIFPNKFLKEYKYCIWIDSNIDITSNILEKRIQELIAKKEIISVNIHPERKCIYQEAKVCIDLQKDDPEIILKEVNFLKKEKYPQDNGLFENNIIFREHNNTKIIKLMENWWWMIENFSRRDQLSFNYVIWKNKLKCTSLFPQNTRFMNDDFKFNDHNTKIVSTLSLDTGNGFNDSNFIQKIISVSNGKYKAIFNLSEFKKIKQVKLNILKNNFCQFKINKIKINNKAISLSEIKYTTNGNLIDNGFIDFSKTPDPQIILSINNKKIKIIKIIGKLNLYNLEHLYLQLKDQTINLTQEKKDLQSETEQLKTGLNKIQSSKTYKLWQKFNKIKKYLSIK